MDALTAQGSVFTAAALRRLQIDTQRLGFQLSQPADPLQSDTHTHEPAERLSAVMLGGDDNCCCSAHLL